MRRSAPSAPVSRHGDPSPTDPRPGPRRHDDLDVRLIRPVQIYLALRRLGVAPGPTLERAWLAFFEAADPVVHAAARSSLRGDDAQADGIQEAWREILASLPAYRHDPARGRLCDWLFILARRACGRMARRRAAAPFELLPPGAEEGLEGRESCPWAGLERAERRERLRRGFAELRGRAGPVEFLAAVLHWAGGQTTADVADRLCLTDGQARGYLTRSAVKLRDGLGEP